MPGHKDLLMAFRRRHRLAGDGGIRTLYFSHMDDEPSDIEICDEGSFCGRDVHTEWFKELVALIVYLKFHGCRVMWPQGIPTGIS